MSDEDEWGTDEHLRLELRHLAHGAAEDEVHVGLGPIAYRFAAESPDAVLERAREVLRATIVAILRGWDPDSDNTPDEIPEWFRRACAPEGQSSAERWSLAAWLPWADPDERQWFLVGRTSGIGRCGRGSHRDHRVAVSERRAPLLARSVRRATCARPDQ